MIVYLISSLIAGAIVFKLGSYSTIIAMMMAGSKVMAAILAAAALVLLYMKFVGALSN